MKRRLAKLGTAALPLFVTACGHIDESVATGAEPHAAVIILGLSLCLVGGLLSVGRLFGV